MTGSPYSLLLICGIVITFSFWRRIAKHEPRLLLIYLAGLGGAFLGAKLVYLAAEGWMFWNSPNRWMAWATGKSVLGALLGGYAGVEQGKKMIGYTARTGDRFASIAPLGISIGRIGCLLHGCCLGRPCEPAWWTLEDAQGVSRWPAVPLELAFNLFAIACFAFLRWRRLLTGQHFHLYLIGYGFFRFGNEWLRATPRWSGEFSGYHLAALGVAGFGMICFMRRARAQA